jgi:hypothetical protein
MISSRSKVQEGRITSAVCAVDLHAKLGQMPFQRLRRQRLLPFG